MHSLKHVYLNVNKLTLYYCILLKENIITLRPITLFEIEMILSRVKFGDLIKAIIRGPVQFPYPLSINNPTETKPTNANMLMQVQNTLKAEC